MSEDFAHRPVLVERVVELFAPVPPGVVVDATVGGGGHAAALLEAHPHLRILGLDRDARRHRPRRRTLEPFGDRVDPPPRPVRPSSPAWPASSA